MGDSITEGAGASCVERGYVSVFGKISGADVRNYGIGGTRIARQKQPSDESRYNLYFVMRVDDMDDDPDAGIEAAKAGGIYALAVGAAQANKDAHYSAENLGEEKIKMWI